MSMHGRVPIEALGVIAALALVAGCAGSAPSPAAPSSPQASPARASAAATTAPTPTTTAAPTATPTPGPTPIAILPGEPWILYEWFHDGKDTKDLFLVRPDGSDAHAIVTDIPGEHRAAAWSPDGTKIAFVVRDTETPDGSIWTANADGSGATRLFDGGGACKSVYHPSWSPDGSKLVMVCYPDDSNASVAILDIASMSLRTLVTVALPEFLDNPPRWSPDGASIAFPILHWDPTNDHLDGSLVATVPAAGGKVRRLTTFDTNMSSPDWRPDGSELAMNSYDLSGIQDTDQPSNLYAIKPDGTGLRQLTHSSVNGEMRIAQPRWTPDGTGMYVSVATTAGPGSTRVARVQPAFVDARGGEPVLVSSSVSGAHPELRPTP
jgi:Tol biopolymer transport system component